MLVSLLALVASVSAGHIAPLHARSLGSAPASAPASTITARAATPVALAERAAGSPLPLTDYHYAYDQISGYNQVNSIQPSSLCQTAIINSAADFCLWGSPGLTPTGTIGDVEAAVVAYCNPLGGLVYSSGLPSGDGSTLEQVSSWNNFIVCFKLCDPSYGTDKNYCQNIYDLIGCSYNAPAAYAPGVFESCEGDLQDEVGTYTDSNGATKTWSQPSSLPANSVLPWTPRIPASSNCVQYQSSDLYPAASLGYAANEPARTTAPGSAATPTGVPVAGSSSGSASGSVAAPREQPRDQHVVGVGFGFDHLELLQQLRQARLVILFGGRIHKGSDYVFVVVWKRARQVAGLALERAHANGFGSGSDSDMLVTRSAPSTTMPKSSMFVRVEVLGFFVAFAFLTWLLASTESSHFQSPLSAFPQTSPLLAKDYAAAVVDSDGVEEIGPVGPGKGIQWRRRSSALRWKVTKGTAPRLVVRKGASQARLRVAKRASVNPIPGVEEIKAEVEMR
ncbi:hypothetical protein RQP46_009138 [Phenoliferia psychrophenolica]